MVELKEIARGENDICTETRFEVDEGYIVVETFIKDTKEVLVEVVPISREGAVNISTRYTRDDKWNEVISKFEIETISFGYCSKDCVKGLIWSYERALRVIEILEEKYCPWQGNL